MSSLQAVIGDVTCDRACGNFSIPLREIESIYLHQQTTHFTAAERQHSSGNYANYTSNTTKSNTK